MKPMPPITLLTDDELLSSNDPEAFGVFYDRHVKALLGYFARRTYDAEEAADLTAETFASERGVWPTTSARATSRSGCGARSRWSADRSARPTRR